MTNSTDPWALTEREEHAQLHVASTLLALVQEDAPAALWRMDSDGAYLDGQIFGDTDTDRRRGLAAWQRVIGSGPVETTQVGAHSHLTVRGSYEGVPVSVVTVVAADLAPCCQGCQEHVGGVA